MAALAQQLVARRDLDEDRDVAPRRHGHAEQRHLQPQNLEELVVEAEALVFARRRPAFELDDELDALRGSRRRNAEQILDVDHAEAAQLHVVARQLGARADEDRLLPAPDFDRVVRHQPVAADDQIERALALADAALAGNQHAEPQDVHQYRVNHRPFGERVLENRRKFGDGRRRGDRGLEERQPRALRLDEQLRGRRESAGDEDAREVEREREAQRRDASRRFEAFEVPDLALAEDQHAPGLEILVKARQREAGLLDVRARDDAVQAVGARQELERQAERFGTAAQQNGDVNARLRQHLNRSR